MRSSGPIVLLFAALFASPASSADTSSSQERLRKACRDIMGFNPGESHFDGCMQSLGRSLQREEEIRARAAAYHNCMAKDLKPGSTNFAPCVMAPVEKVEAVRKD